MTFLIGEQPRSKSKALILLMSMRTMVPPYRRQGWSVSCFGNKGHYWKDGSCPHVWGIRENLKTDWHRARLWFLPFGGPTNEYKRASRAKMVLRQEVAHA
ncbi:hypothetical protein LCGC14_2250740 [marine sediment metagenome]|uniref:Uncharacterized protein n=1 Tax=marine sediment metagenome TaxID=412755 RepID=A0A0F9FXP5_9ZZZZ